MNILYILILISYIIFSFFASKNIRKATHLNKKKKKQHQMWVWCVPFISIIILQKHWFIVEKKRLDVMTKSKRHFKENIKNPGHYDALY